MSISDDPTSVQHYSNIPTTFFANLRSSSLGQKKQFFVSIYFGGQFHFNHRIKSMSTSIPHNPRKSTRRRPDPPATNENAASELIVPPKSDVGSNFPFDMDDGDDDDEFDITNQPWRQYGLRRRQYLLENDKAATSYRMNAACSIQKYFSLSERVRYSLYCRKTFALSNGHYF